MGKLLVARTGTDFNKAFNITTGNWLSYYVFKRLRFMNSVLFSQTSTMLFCALWHGLASGYFVSFGIQGLNLTFERYFFSQLDKCLFVQKLKEKYKNSTLVNFCYQIFIWAHKLLYTPVVLLGMHTFTVDRYWPIMKSMGVHWILISYLILPLAVNVIERGYKRYCNFYSQSGVVHNGIVHKKD